MPVVETVLGSIPAEALGITLLHEHVLCDLSCWLREPSKASKRQYMDKPVTIEDLWVLRRDPLISKDNLRLHDIPTAVEELNHFRGCGGKTVVCQSLPGIGRDPIALRRISVETGLNIIAATGWYMKSSHPPEIAGMGVDKLSEIMVKELMEGIEGTGIKAGLIGECACSLPLPYHPDEKKVLQAACRVQSKTGVGFTFHPCLYDPDRKAPAKTAEAYVELIEKEGGDLSKFFLSHADYTCLDLNYHKKLLEKGITLSYDTFGRVEGYYDSVFPGMRLPTDSDRVDALVKLCQEGYDKQLVMAQDACIKTRMKKFGGYGYSHVLEHIVPILKRANVKEKQTRNMLVENPKRLLGH